MLNFNRHHPFYVFIFLVLFSMGASAQQEKAAQEIQDLMKKYEAIGLTVAVVKDNQLLYTQAFGLKNKENQTPLTETDVFRIASISKSFSATAMMQLVEQGKLSLSDDFSDLVGFKVRNPAYPETVITLKMVLSHTSSINDSQGYFNLDVINPAKNPDWAKCYNGYQPGKGYEYCNLNFNMVGTIIEKESGERFDQYIKHHILDPLGLYGGYCVDSLDHTRFATLYEYDGTTKGFTASPAAYAPRREEIKNYVMGYSTPIFSPTGGMKISAPDLAKYMTMHMNMGKYDGRRVISKKSAKMMQTQVATEDGYGLAIRSVNNLIPGKSLKGHTGSAYGLYSSMFFQPKEKFGFVVITNGANPVESNGFVNLTAEVINSLYKNLIK
jgi:CubicO group peptidase (beta-lactamase class C family)